MDLDAVVAEGKAAGRLLHHQVAPRVLIFKLGPVHMEDSPDGLPFRVLQDEAPDEAEDVKGRLQKLDDNVDRLRIRRERIGDPDGLHFMEPGLAVVDFEPARGGDLAEQASAEASLAFPDRIDQRHDDRRWLPFLRGRLWRQRQRGDRHGQAKRDPRARTRAHRALTPWPLSPGCATFCAATNSRSIYCRSASNDWNPDR